METNLLYMKKILSILFISLTCTLSAQQADSLFSQANKLYQKEQYSDALKSYKTIEDNNVQSDKLFYNIANANYKLNRVAPAIYYYEKALMLNPNNADAKFNLKFAEQMTLDNIEPLPKTFSQKISDNIIQKLSYNTWAWLAVSLSLLFAVLVLSYHFSYNTVNKRFYFVTSIACVVLVLITIVFAYHNFNTIKSNNPAIIFAQQVDVKSAPTMSSEVNFQLHEGTKVQILERLDNWDKIKIADGKIGWIVTDELKELK